MNMEITTKKNILAGIYYNSNGYHISVNRIYTTKNNQLKELENKFVGSIQEVSDLLQTYGVSIAVIDALYPNKTEIQRLQQLNEYTKQVVYSVMFTHGIQMFTVDRKNRIVHVGLARSFYADLATYTQIACILYTEHIN